MNANEVIELMQALNDGKTLQFETAMGWVDSEVNAVDANSLVRGYKYRVKPEPVTVIANVYRKPNSDDEFIMIHDSMEDAERHAGLNKSTFIRTIKLQKVEE